MSGPLAVSTTSAASQANAVVMDLPPLPICSRLAAATTGASTRGEKKAPWRAFHSDESHPVSDVLIPEVGMLPRLNRALLLLSLACSLAVACGGDDGPD